MTKKTDTQEKKEIAIEDMPLNSLRDYRLYNERARAMNKKLRKNAYPIKQCPVDLHPKKRIHFTRNDGSTMPVPVYKSDHIIHYDEKWYPGQVYDVPEYICDYMHKKGYPIWGWVDLRDGGRETRKVNKTPRFSINTVYDGE